MITLIKIRRKYLSNHYCAVYWSYFFIPSIILILTIISFLKIKIKKYSELNKFEGKSFNLNESLLSQYIFVFKIYNFSFISNDEKDKIILQELIKKDIEWFYQENEEFDQALWSKINKRNIIIKINNKNERYKINLIQSDENGIFFYFLNTFSYSNLFQPPDNNTNYFLFFNEFIQLQSLLSQFLIRKKGNSYSHKELYIEIGYNSYPPHTDIKNGDIFILSIIISLHFTLISYFFCIRMIEEKEKKLTELLERQGISKKDYFFSWLFIYLFIIIIPVIIYVIFYIMIYQLHILLFLLNMILFSFSLYLFTYFLYICISRSQTGSILIKLINFGSSILGFVLVIGKFNKLKIILALFPQINIYYCTNCIEKLMRFKKLSKELICLEANNISFIESIVMYLLDIILYSLLLLFISKYKQSGLGLFQFLISCCQNVSRKINHKRENENDLKVLNFEKHFQDLSPFNQQRKSKNDCLSIVNVTKYFDSLKAVDDFNGDLFGNEIFCLLGHNGAGKSTLINMISGILDPTEGDIFYKGKSLVTNKDYLFENIGICQQEDIFFEYLTVSEHLKYMCEIKGSKSNIEEIKNLIKNIGLEEKSNSLCNTLSGGQKRKLCTALALIGNSNIILLDEPTSGMDPITRKALWIFLKKYQRNKIILVTTHSLEEAEYLGDKIGIMSDGQFICCGTSSFLKSKYPCGFNINLVINSDKFSEEKKNNFLEKIKSYESNVQIRIASKSVLSLNIQSNSQHFSDIFSFIEESKIYYDIEDYTVASTSLEDIFLKINNQSNLNEMKYINKKMGSQEILIPENLIEINNCFAQFICQLKRNFLPIYRNKLILIIEYLSGLGIIYILYICFPKLYEAIDNACLNLLKIFENNPVYIYTDKLAQGVLEDSYAYDIKNTF